MNNNDVIIYTDGSSRGNPGPGGYGIVMEDCKTGFSKQYSKGFQKTTNNYFAEKLTRNVAFCSSNTLITLAYN